MSASSRPSWGASWIRMQGQLMRGRQRTGLTQEQLAIRLGVHRRTIQRWEDGDSDPSSRDLYRWADALGLSIHAVPFGEGDSCAAIPDRDAPPAFTLKPFTTAHLAAPSLDDGDDAADGLAFHGNSARPAFPTPTGSAR